MDQRQKSKYLVQILSKCATKEWWCWRIRFYLGIFFDFRDVACTKAILFTTWCIHTILHCSISNILFQPTWLEDTQVEAEHYQMAKQVLKENINISLSKITYNQIFQSLKIFGDGMNITAKMKLTEKLTLNTQKSKSLSLSLFM